MQTLDCDRHNERNAEAAANLNAVARTYEILWLWNHRIETALTCARLFGNEPADETAAAVILEALQNSIIRRRTAPNRGGNAETTF